MELQLNISHSKYISFVSYSVLFSLGLAATVFNNLDYDEDDCSQDSNYECQNIQEEVLCPEEVVSV